MKKHIRILVQICIKSAFQWRILMGSPQRPITSLHPNPPLIRKSRFSTEIKLAQGRGRGARMSTEGGREGVGKNILGFWFRFVSKVLSNGGS